MTSIPSEDAINEFVAITNATRDQAVSLLKANNLDANRAVNAFFETPNGSLAQGDWPVSSGPQPENYGYQNGQKSFNIDRGDPSHTAPPSRPPSRIGNHQSLEGASRQEGQGLARYLEDSSKMTLEEREEREMQQAMAASLDRSFEPADDQETGVITTQGTQFGPANREYYDTASWAITTYRDPETKEECVHPDPEERMRRGLPAFLRPSKNVDSLGALLTILHAIPLAREALLSRDKLIPDYGYHPHWWNGTRIHAPSPSPSADGANPTMDAPDEVLLETQRLMAFLDGTKRSYGSVDALANLLSARRDAPRNFLPEFLIKWQLAACPLDEDRRSGSIFESAIHRKFSISDADPTLLLFPNADLSFEVDRADTLYDVIDTNLWPDTPDNRAHEAWMDTVAPVFIMRLSTRSTSDEPIGVKIPPVWYPDRYMESNKEFTQQLRTYRLEAEAELERLEKLILKYSTAQLPSGQAMSFKSLLEKTSLAADVALKGHPLYQENVDGEETPKPALSAEETEKLRNDLKTISDKIDQKLTSLYEKKEEVNSRLREFASGLTTKEGDGPPYHKYTLRGVCTQEHVMYVLKQIAGADFNECAGQWWRISYSVDDAKELAYQRLQKPLISTTADGTEYYMDPTKPRVPIPNHMEVAAATVKAVGEFDVLRAAQSESSSVLLVYANEDAVQFKKLGLPQPLQNFVDKDNKAFEDEIWDLKVRLSMEGTEEPLGEEEKVVESIEIDALSPLERQPPYNPDRNVPLNHPQQEVVTHSNYNRPNSSRKAVVPAPINETLQGATEEDMEQMDVDRGYGKGAASAA